MESYNYTVKTTSFEGPFGLLLDLVEKRKLFINDVSLATVTEDYLNYVNKLGGSNSLHPTEISSFIIVAATLILIKSKSLLPNLNLTIEEEGDIKNLEERLRLYELFTKLGENIKNNFGQEIIFAPLERKNAVLVFLPDEQITKYSMMSFARNVLGSMPKKVFLPKVEVQKVISIEEMIEKLTNRIKDSIQTSFQGFTGKATTREEKIFVIVGFLAMLELVRNGILHVVQENNFTDIIISKSELEFSADNFWNFTLEVIRTGDSRFEDFLWKAFKDSMNLESQIEAILFWKGESISRKKLSEILKVGEIEINESIEKLKENLKERGIVLLEKENEISFGTAPEFSKLIEDLQKEELNKELSKASLETLSIVLYKNGVSRAEIDYIRGVNSSFTLRALSVRGLIEKTVDSKDNRRYIYKPSFALLSFMGIKSVEELPDYTEVSSSINIAAKNLEDLSVEA